MDRDSGMHTELTPNPDSVKWIVPCDVPANVPAVALEPGISFRYSPLGVRLFAIEGVQSVFWRAIQLRSTKRPRWNGGLHSTSGALLIVIESRARKPIGHPRWRKGELRGASSGTRCRARVQRQEHSRARRKARSISHCQGSASILCACPSHDPYNEKVCVGGRPHRVLRVSAF